MKLLGDETPTLTIDGRTFRDLNKNGKLDVYEDSRAALENRVDDLISQIQLDGKVGLMSAHFLGMEEDPSLLEMPTTSDPFSFMTESTSGTILKNKMSHVQNLGGASAEAKWISVWPFPLGLGATGDTVLVREFGAIARQEYLAIGIRLAQHPMADIATDPRWARVNGTFGEDAHRNTLFHRSC